MQNTKAYAINFAIDGYKTLTTIDVMQAAETLRTDYPKVARIIGIDSNVIPAIKAALKTASGIASVDKGIIATNIHNLSKLELAVLIASNDSSDGAFDRAAYEISRVAFISGDLDSKAKALADASGRSQEACLKLIRSKLSRKKAELVSHLKALMDVGQAPRDPAEVLDYILANDGATLLALPTAYGKTSKIIEPVLSEEMARGSNVLVLCHRRSINRNIANIPGIVSYDECDTPDILENARGLKMVVNSIANPKFKKQIEDADVVVIDEASQVIAHVLGGEVKNREAVWEALCFVVKNAKKVIFADADINTRCVEILDGRPAKLFKIAQDHSGITVKTSDSGTVRGLVVKAAKDGKKILVACDGAREAAALAKHIEKKVKRSVLVITAENSKWEAQAAFIANPNSMEHEIVIYSPVITSALSITSKHFECHFGLFGGQVVPSDAIQMMRRDRTAELFTVGLKNPDYKKSAIVEIAFKKEMVAVEELLKGLTINADAKAKIRAAIAADNAPTAFESMRYDHCSSEAWLKDNVQYTLPALLLMQGFVVEALERDDETSKLGFVADSQGRKSVKAETAAKLLRSAPASTQVVRAVNDSGSNDEVEYLSVIRARAQEVMGRSQLSQADAKLWGEGEGEAKIKLFKRLYSVTSVSPDDELAVFSKILPAIAEMSLTKDWRADDSSALFDRLNTMRSKVIGLGINMPRANTAKAKQAAVTNVLKCFGIKTKMVDGGKSGNYYIIDQASVDQMASYFKLGAPL